MIVHANSVEEFEKEVKSGLVLVDFFATWCGPCKMLAPVLEEVSNEQAKAKIVKLDVDLAGQVAARYEVMAVPTMILFKDGKPVGKLVGFAPKQQILKLINNA